MYRKKVIIPLLGFTLVAGLSFGADLTNTDKGPKVLEGTAATTDKETNVPAGTPGSRAVNFTLKDLAGKDTNILKEFDKKKAIIIVFGTTWCHYCLAEIPALKTTHEKYKDKGVVIVQVDSQESKERVQGMVNKYKIPYVVLLDEDGAVARQYKIMGVPTILFLDRNKMIKWRSSGGEQDYNGRLQELGIR